MTTPSDNQSTSSATTSSIIYPQNQLVSVKLDDSNFLKWKQQVLTALRGYGLIDFISKDGTTPQQFIQGKNDQQTLNPNFTTWQRQDQLLASWILSSLTEGILILMVGFTTSREIWNALESYFTNQSLAKVMQYKLKLQTMKKGNLSMREYLSQMKCCFDVLASAGEPISERDQVLHVLTGLDGEYNSVMVNVTSRLEPVSLMDLQALLLSYESRLEYIAPIVNTDGSQPSVHIATQNSQRRNMGTNQFYANNNRNRATQFSSQGNRGGRVQGRNGYRGRGGRFGQSRLICQVCQVAGHTADRCWYRFDQTYGNNTTSQQQNMSNTRGPTLNVAQFSRPGSSSISDIASESSWYPDSGASNHVTNDLANLNIASEYHGGNRLHMGNGAGSNHTGCPPQGNN